MNVFVLNAGRCGSSTFAEACRHITNYTSGHETRADKINDRLKYPSNHIEVDNQLSFMLGRLDEQYGNEGAYVHLKRNLCDTAKSWVKKENMHARKGRIWFYENQIILGKSKYDQIEVAKHYCKTVNKNIEKFIKDKNKKMTIEIESAENRAIEFFEMIKAKGDIDSFKDEFTKKHNSIENVSLFKMVKNKMLKKLEVWV